MNTMNEAGIHRAALLGSALFCLAVSAPVRAQDEQVDSELQPGSIIVTASKREQTLQDTPISVAVASADRIEASQVRDLLDLQTLVPSLRVNQLQTSANTNFIIRGFGNGANNPGIEPSVGVFIDGVYRSRSAAQISDLPNLQRVEVLRGPQSTLFSKNASAGIINIVTRPPQFDFSGSAELQYGNLDAVIMRSHITGPVSDTLAISASASLNRRDGYVRDINLNTGNNERDRWGLRGQALFEPHPDLSIRMIADYDRIDENCCSVTNVVDGPTGNAIRALGGQVISNDRFGTINALNFPSTNQIENYGVSLQADAALEHVDVTAIGAYRRVDSLTNQDIDFTSADLVQRAGGDLDIDTFTLELRASTRFDESINLLGGIYLFKEELTSKGSLEYGADFRGYANFLSGGALSSVEPLLRFLIPDIPAEPFGGQGQGRFTDYQFDNDAIAIFGQLDLEITEGLTLSVGGNYTSDKKSVIDASVSTDVFSRIDLIEAGVRAGVPAALADNADFNPFLQLRQLQFSPPFLNLPNAVEDGKTSDDKLTYTIRGVYELSDSLSLYVTNATGFKASSVNLSADSRPSPADFIPGSPFQDPPPPSSPVRDAGLAKPNLTAGSRFAAPERAEVYEVGLKGQWQDIAVNLAVFDQTLNDFQGNFFTGTGFILANAERQSVRGFEFDASISPVRDLIFTAALTYLDAEYDSFDSGTAIDPDTFTTSLTNLTGQRPANIPEWAASFGARYSLVLDDGNRLTFYADYLHESNTQIAEGLSAFRREVNQINGSIGFEFANGLELMLWGRNLTNDVYNLSVFPAIAQIGSLSAYRNPPRTYGGMVRVNF